MSNSSLVSGQSEASGVEFSRVEVSQRAGKQSRHESGTVGLSRGLLRTPLGGPRSRRGARRRRAGAAPGSPGPGTGKLVRALAISRWLSAVVSDHLPPTRQFFTDFLIILFFFRLSWETSTKEDVAPEAADRPETRLELLTRISSIRFFSTFSSRVE